MFREIQIDLRALVALLVTLACVLAPVTVLAQQEPDATAKSDPTEAYDAYFMSDEHRQEIYRANRKSVAKAALLTLAFPGLGNVYAEQYMIAAVAIVFMVFAATFVGFGVSTGQRNIVVVGLGTAGIAYGGGMAASVHGVNVFNRKLREGLKVEGARVGQKWSPMLTFRF